MGCAGVGLNRPSFSPEESKSSVPWRARRLKEDAWGIGGAESASQRRSAASPACPKHVLFHVKGLGQGVSREVPEASQRLFQEQLASTGVQALAALAAILGVHESDWCILHLRNELSSSP